MSRGQRAAKNVLVTIATQLFVWGLSFAVTLFMPRYVGSAGIGEIGIAGAYVALFEVFVSLGTSTVLIKEVARDRGKVPHLLATALGLRVPVSVGLALLAVGLSHVMGHPIDIPLTRQVILIFSVWMVINTVNDVFYAVLQGEENMARQSAITLIDRILGATATITLIFLRAPVPLILMTNVVSGLIALSLNIATFRGHLPHLRAPSRGALLALASTGLPFLGWNVFRTLYGQTDPLILGMVASAITVGWYAAASKLVGTTLFFPSAVTTALLPPLAALYGEGNRREFGRLARQLLSLCLLMGMPLALVFLCLPGRLIGLLHYPADFNGSIPVLRVAGISSLFYFIAMAIGQSVIASDGHRAMLRASVWGAVVGIPACFGGSWLAGHTGLWFLGGGNAAVGAMASDVFLEAVLIAFYLRALPPGTFGRESLSLTVRYLLAALPMGAVLLSPMGTRWGLWSVLPGGAAYLVACVVLGCIDRDAIGMVRQFLARRRGGALGSELGSESVAAPTDETPDAEIVPGEPIILSPMAGS